MIRCILIAVVLTSVIHSRSCSYNHTKQCFVLSNKVILNVTFTDPSVPKIQGPDIQMQTKDILDDAWKSLTNCSRSSRSLQCDVENDPGRLRYSIRVVNTKSKDLLMDDKEIYHKNGFPCYLNHDNNIVQNFKVSNVTSKSVDVS